MRIQLLVIMIVGYGSIEPSDKGLARNHGTSSEKRMGQDFARRAIEGNRQFAVLHFRDSLQPLLESFRRKFGQREQSLLIESQVDKLGNVKAWIVVQFPLGGESLKLSADYSAQKIALLRQEETQNRVRK